MKRLKPHLPIMVLLASLAVIFSLRYVVVMRHLDMGQDIATYLSTMHTFFGRDVAGVGLDRPPLIALLLKPFTLAFGDLTGVKVVGLLLSVLIGIPFYLLARRILPPWIAVATTIGFVFSPGYSNMLSWGYITMTGILFTLLTLHFFLLVLEKPSKQNVILTGLFASLIVGFHQLSLAFFVPLLLILVSVLLLFNRQTLFSHWRPAVAALVVAVILSTPYIPIYLRLLSWESSPTSSATISITPLAQVVTELFYLPYLWGLVLALALAIIALKWTWQQNRNIAITIVVMLLYSLILSLFLLPAPFAELNRRAHYFLYAPLWLTVGVMLSHLWAWRTTLLPGLIRWLPRVSAIAIIAALLSTNIVASQRQLQSGPGYFGYLDESRWDAVQWIRENTPQDAFIATYPEALGWWVEAEAGRKVANVTDRNMVPYALLGERSLITERILSRNMGLDNGQLLLAMTWPYDNAPGDPVLAAYVGGFYRDIFMFDDGQSYLTEGNSTSTLTDVANKEITTTGDSDSMQVTASYQIFDIAVAQTVKLDRGSQTATISYSLRSPGSASVHLDIPMLFCIQPKSISIDANLHSIETVQDIETAFNGIVPVSTRLTIEVNGDMLELTNQQDQQIDLSFDMQSTDASITFNFAITTPNIDSSTDVTYYEVPQLIKDNSVDYIAVDLSPDSHIWSDLPPGIEEWLTNCPYYKLVYPLDDIGNIRVYQIDRSALP
jgi:hypothetical protein